MSKILVVLLLAGLITAASAYSARTHDDDDDDDDEPDHEEEHHYYQLFQDLAHHYEKRAIPIGEDKAPLKVEFGVTLRHINVDPGSQELTLLGWAKLQWQDHRLKWDPEHYDGIERIQFCEKQIWTPDTSLYNGLDVDYFPHNDHTDVIVTSDGKALWVPPVQFRVYASHFSLEESTTFSVQVGSWTYDDTFMDLQLFEGAEGFDLSDYTSHHCWNVEQTSVERSLLHYPCCSEGYPKLSFYLTVQYSC